MSTKNAYGKGTPGVTTPKKAPAKAVEQKRLIKVHPSRSKPYYPFVIFGGKYLLNLGFKIGDRVEIRPLENGQLQIIKEGAKTDEIQA